MRRCCLLFTSEIVFWYSFSIWTRYLVTSSPASSYACLSRFIFAIDRKQKTNYCFDAKDCFPRNTKKKLSYQFLQYWLFAELLVQQRATAEFHLVVCNLPYLQQILNNNNHGNNSWYEETNENGENKETTNRKNTMYIVKTRSIREITLNGRLIVL